MKFTIRHRLIQVQAPNSRKTYTLTILERIQGTKSLQEVHYKFKIIKGMQSRIQKKIGYQGGPKFKWIQCHNDSSFPKA